MAKLTDIINKFGKNNALVVTFGAIMDNKIHFTFGDVTVESVLPNDVTVTAKEGDTVYLVVEKKAVKILTPEEYKETTKRSATARPSSSTPVGSPERF
jgi:hypothetical protein